jgi:hypothetical protein
VIGRLYVGGDAEVQEQVHCGDVIAAWARRSESDPFAARKVIHLRA